MRKRLLRPLAAGCVCLALCRCGGAPTSPSAQAPATGTTIPATSLTFSVSPIPESAIEFITPLGNLTPPDHTLPTDHIYLYHHLNHRSAPAFDVVAPAAGTVGAIVQHGDQKVYVRVTSRQTYYLDHVVLDPAIRTNVTLSVGQRLGVTGSGSFGLDLGVVNDDVTLPFARAARYGAESLHADAPLRFFAEPLRSALYAMVQRAGDDKDGEICFDRAGTLAGNWFLDTLPVQESAVVSAGPMQVGFVRDAADPAAIRVSIGGTLALTGTFGVAPGSPDPASVTPATGPIVYRLSSAAFGFAGGALRAEMVGPETVRLEAFPGGADASAFTAAARVYVR